MPEKTRRPRRVTDDFSGVRVRALHTTSSSPYRRNFLPLPRPKRRKHFRTLSRSASEPSLLTFTSIDSGGVEGGGICYAAVRLPRTRTCADVVSPSPSPGSKSSSTMRDSMEKVKVVVSVAVEGSPGPVKAMVMLGTSVEELIDIAIRKYGSEGRSPRLDLEVASSFELHHSHFTLQSLKKSDKIGEVGGRSFYLRTSGGGHGPDSRLGETTSTFPEPTNEVDRFRESQNSPVISSPLPFLTAIALKLNTIERRTKRICKLMACFFCV